MEKVVATHGIPGPKNSKSMCGTMPYFKRLFGLMNLYLLHTAAEEGSRYYDYFVTNYLNFVNPFNNDILTL